MKLDLSFIGSLGLLPTFIVVFRLWHARSSFISMSLARRKGRYPQGAEDAQKDMYERTSFQICDIYDSLIIVIDGKLRGLVVFHP